MASARRKPLLIAALALGALIGLIWWMLAGRESGGDSTQAEARRSNDPVSSRPKTVEITEATVVEAAQPETTPAALPDPATLTGGAHIPPAAAIPLRPQLIAKWTEITRNVMAGTGGTWDEAMQRFKRENAVEIAAVESASGQRFAFRRPGQPGFPATLIPKDAPEPVLPRRFTDFHSARTGIQKECQQFLDEAAKRKIAPSAALREWELANSSRLTEHRRAAAELRELPWNHASAQPQRPAR